MMAKRSKGFTLVELIVVIAVIALISIGALVAFRGIRESAIDEVVNADANRLKDHMSAYRSLLPDSNTFTDTGEHAFCSMCIAIGTPGNISHASGCGSEISVEIIWNNQRKNASGHTAWQVAGLSS